MHDNCIRYLVSPITRKKLQQKGDSLHTQDQSESYQIINDIPILLTDGSAATYHREIMEVLFWQFPGKVDEWYAEWDHASWPYDSFKKYISTYLKDKNGIISAIQSYSQAGTRKWIIQHPTEPVSTYEIDTFNRRSAEKYAVDMVMSTRDTENKRFDSQYLPKYTDLIHAARPSVIVELSTGAGMGTAAVADKKASDCIMFTLDISYGCHGNAVGIADYLDIRNSLFPVCANFWYCPFADQSVDVVCSCYGLDESRETPSTISEVSRMLKKGGNFVNVSISSALWRQYELFKQYGFSYDETKELMKVARLYCDTDELINECSKHGLELKERYLTNECNDYRALIDFPYDCEVTFFNRI